METPRSTDQPTLVSRARRVEEPDFRAAFDLLPSPKTVWGATEEATVVGGGAAATLCASGDDRFESIREAADWLFDSGDVHAGTEAACPRLFGGFAFHAAGADDEPWTEFPGARFVLPRVQVTYADNGTWITVNAVGHDADAEDVEARLAEVAADVDGATASTPRPPRPGIVEKHRTTTLEEWRRSVDSAVDHIEAGRLRKVVLAQALRAELAGELSRSGTLERLDERYPECHLFFTEPTTGEQAFLGATPETLVSLQGRTVETAALAGTTGRGETPAEDEWLADELLADEKNVHEHELVADAIREQLSPYTASISTGERRIKRLATVQHLHTPMTAELASDQHVLDLVEALHPTPAVGGLPPDAALDTIRETEPFDRGWYAAPVGWIDAAGNGTFAVALRSAVVESRQATLFAGVGIVADSDPDREWDEVQLKYRPILDELEADDRK